MTVDDVVRHVAETPGWYLDEFGCIRRMAGHDTECCPISSLENADALWWGVAAANQGVGLDDGSDIVLAADSPLGTIEANGWSDRDLLALRRRLLEAARLTEVSE